MSEEQQLQKTTGQASPFLEPAETIRAAARGPRASSDTCWARAARG